MFRFIKYKCVFLYCRRVLKNKTHIVAPEKHPLNHPLRVAENPKKENPSSIKKAIGKIYGTVGPRF